MGAQRGLTVQSLGGLRIARVPGFGLVDCLNQRLLDRLQVRVVLRKLKVAGQGGNLNQRAPEIIDLMGHLSLLTSTVLTMIDPWMHFMILKLF